MKLFSGAPEPGGNIRCYVELEDGRSLPLPFAYRPEELILPGNYIIDETGLLFALYDETTRTGLMYCGFGDVPFWNLIQPVTRENFFVEQWALWRNGLKLHQSPKARH